MNLPILPVVTIPGRIANRLCIRHSKNGYDYVQILIYILQDNKATLMPMIAFNRFAHKIVKVAQQGDLVNMKAKLDPISHGQFVAITLMAYSFAFLEPKRMRSIYHGKKGKQLHVLFPVIPNDVGEAVRLSKQAKVARKATKKKRSKKARESKKTKAPVIKANVVVRPRKKTKKKHHTKNKGAKQSHKRHTYDFGGFHPNTDNIFKEASKITHSNFWSNSKF